MLNDKNFPFYLYDEEHGAYITDGCLDSMSGACDALLCVLPWFVLYVIASLLVYPAHEIIMYSLRIQRGSSPSW